MNRSVAEVGVARDRTDRTVAGVEEGRAASESQYRVTLPPKRRGGVDPVVAAEEGPEIRTTVMASTSPSLSKSPVPVPLMCVQVGDSS